jgi:hypothetical protein
MIFALAGYDNCKVWDRMKASLNMKGGFSMMDFTWKVFLQTGNIDTYLLIKELEKENQEIPGNLNDELAQIDFPVS